MELKETKLPLAAQKDNVREYANRAKKKTGRWSI